MRGCVQAQFACLLDYLSPPSRLTQTDDTIAQEGDNGFLHILFLTHLTMFFAGRQGPKEPMLYRPM
jgi:hypothetical protein